MTGKEKEVKCVDLSKKEQKSVCITTKNCHSEISKIDAKNLTTVINESVKI
jgi:hypothetical protein